LAYVFLRKSGVNVAINSSEGAPLWIKSAPASFVAALPSAFHAEQDDLQVWKSLLEQPAAISGGGAVEAPIQQKPVRRIRCQSTDQGFHISNLDNTRCVHFASK